MSVIKKGANTVARYVIIAFLTVVIIQILIFFGIPGEHIPIKILVTFISLILAAILLRLAVTEKVIVR